MTYNVSYEKLCILAGECVYANRKFWNPRTRGINWSVREFAIAFSLEVITDIPVDKWIKYASEVYPGDIEESISDIGAKLIKLVMPEDKEKPAK